MPNLKSQLKNRLQGAKKIAILGVGSELRGDDAAGILVAGRLEEYRKKYSGRLKFKVFFGETAPENLTGEIKKFKPGHLIIVDSADMDKKAGAIRLIEDDELAGISFCTHRLPLEILAEYLSQSLDCRLITIGIQPKTLNFGSSPTKKIVESARLVSEAIKEAIKA